MIDNCGQCVHLVSKGVMGLTVYGCGHQKWPKKERPVVPQTSQRDLETGSQEARFHRVPEWCPLPDSEAHKRPEARPVEEKQ